jgi:hypothetical protein
MSLQMIASIGLSLTVSAGWAQGSDPAAALHTIRGNAKAARDNARTYRWRPVNLEVDRVASSLHDVEGRLTADPACHDDAMALRQAVAGLRKGRLLHDSPLTMAAAQEVADIASRLLPKSPDPGR